MIELTTADRLEIAELLSIFAWAIDRREPELFPLAFTEDMEAHYPQGTTIRGRDAFAQFVLGVHEHHDATQHFIANLWLLPQEDDVIMRSYVVLTVHWAGQPGGDIFQGGAYYDDRVVRTDAGWRIASRSANRMWQNGNREILEAGRLDAVSRL